MLIVSMHKRNTLSLLRGHLSLSTGFSNINRILCILQRNTLCLLGKEATSLSILFSNMNRIESRLRKNSLSVLIKQGISFSTVVTKVNRIVNSFTINTLSLLRKEGTSLKLYLAMWIHIEESIIFFRKRDHFSFKCIQQCE